MRLLAASTLSPAERDPLLSAFASAPYRAIISVAFEPDRPLSPPGGAYALVNSDRKHAVSWMAFEHCKPGYVPPGREAVVAQMAHSWSAGRLAAADRSIVSDALKSVSGLLGTPVRARWAHISRWPEALPDGLAPREPFAGLEGRGLFFAGDAFTGGRVHLALEDGFEAGNRAAERAAERV
jgi:predicted NAD/FAD-dependent oxidoreductase